MSEILRRINVNGPGSGGNVIAAGASFFIPGLGQLLQGRIAAAAIQFVAASLLWLVLLGWAVHLWSIIDAARYRPPLLGTEEGVEVLKR